MGINPFKIKYLKYFLERELENITLEKIKVYENQNEIKKFFNSKKLYKNFYVTNSWKELKDFQ